MHRRSRTIIVVVSSIPLVFAGGPSVVHAAQVTVDVGGHVDVQLDESFDVQLDESFDAPARRVLRRAG
jgi:hypothetical protein